MMNKISFFPHANSSSAGHSSFRDPRRYQHVLSMLWWKWRKRSTHQFYSLLSPLSRNLVLSVCHIPEYPLGNKCQDLLIKNPCGQHPYTVIYHPSSWVRHRILVQRYQQEFSVSSMTSAFRVRWESWMPLSSCSGSLSHLNKESFIDLISKESLLLMFGNSGLTRS